MVERANRLLESRQQQAAALRKEKAKFAKEAARQHAQVLADARSNAGKVRAIPLTNWLARAAAPALPLPPTTLTTIPRGSLAHPLTLGGCSFRVPRHQVREPTKEAVAVADKMRRSHEQKEASLAKRTALEERRRDEARRCV
jgi:hypothetical protein